MLLPFIPQIVWIIISTGIAIAFLLLTVNFLNWLAPVAWFLIIISALIGTAILIINIQKIIQPLKAFFKKE
ncbi:MAG: hypothetical protein WCQ99_03925 [Pseudomonadota bacterium]